MKKRYSTDAELVKACIACKPAAQRLLYDRHVEIMFNTVMRYTYNQHDTEDILQVAFTKVFKYLERYDADKGTLKSWIRKICITCTIDFFKKKSLKFTPIEDLTPLSSENDLITDEMEIDYILSLIKQLPHHYRIIFNMYEIEGYSHQEIAERLEINSHSCRVYLARAKKQLREAIRSYQSGIKEISS